MDWVGLGCACACRLCWAACCGRGGAVASIVRVIRFAGGGACACGAGKRKDPKITEQERRSHLLAAERSQVLASYAKRAEVVKGRKHEEGLGESGRAVRKGYQFGVLRGSNRSSISQTDTSNEGGKSEERAESKALKMCLHIPRRSGQVLGSNKEEDELPTCLVAGPPGTAWVRARVKNHNSKGTSYKSQQPQQERRNTNIPLRHSAQPNDNTTENRGKSDHQPLPPTTPFPPLTIPPLRPNTPTQTKTPATPSPCREARPHSVVRYRSSAGSP
ncbi:uncharacterized protein K452DRAFT_339559 [Aplosporella prunicola CBS 121167]|uniref:Uncharacterized protein n=1 Tax=Aplosporella prunicola CBS 121167 TaxID=1176127 RepID=A0A6A6B3P3_9PEZI|nr:uncharacterized protein K452DRAFT_339559 [Aplosporella prunicola CBS 121167]KAF2137885.1 hypothetical protein K452DRAFT_339559 [Aplosporella prunicola CBS 121167]